MLRRAREQFPQANFVQQAVTQLDFEAAFDGACSFSSLLHLDPVDFYHAVYRLIPYMPALVERPPFMAMSSLPGGLSR
ncbi:MAG: class I SAM-dependent methyltransferase [Chloroflexi bacterium]|jgi:hypothetical protein|nr:class I SAM-dependent methyltransferase [Chloroflexota bacterium]